ncbi:hypothetical protein DL93DRAFT_2080039, partial [Clavulina sp. PMI_390]
MFRAIARITPRASPLAPASVSAPSCSFHTSPPASESARSQRSRLTKKKNLLRRAELKQQHESSKPHIVLGYAAGQEWLWRNSELAKILVSPAERAPLPLLKGWDREAVAKHQDADPERAYPDPVRPSPNTLNFGVDGESAKVVFQDLPKVAAQRPLLNLNPNASEHDISVGYETALSQQLSASDQMARVMHLSNASAGGIAFENRKRIIKAFSSAQKPNDSGRAEVQAALFTLRIRDMWSHMQQAPRDIHARHSLSILLNQRAKVLRYLKRTDRNRYDAVLPRIGLDPRAVEGEIILR